jgi:hypothetical protein
MKQLSYKQYNTLRSHSLPNLFRSAMREMLDATEEIWLNIFWLNTWLVAALDAISLVTELPSRGEQSGRMRLPGVRKTPRRGKCQALGRVGIDLN